MIAAALLILLGHAESTTTNPYFPMTPNSEWVYELGGQITGTFTMKALEPRIDKLKTDGTKETPFETYSNGALSGSLAYEIQSDALFIVSGANGLPIPHRKVLVFAPDAHWDYYLDSSGIIPSPAVHVINSTKSGGEQSWLGKKTDTLICTSEVKLKDGKKLDLFQISTYAKGIGLVKFVQHGSRDGQKIDTTQTLIKYTPGNADSSQD